jgi:hypothetical protein
MKKKKMLMTFWQVPFDGEDLEFRLQADNLTPQTKRKVKSLLKDWTIVAEGWSKKYELLVFNKMFPDRDKAREFVDNFPEDLIVKGYNGKEISHF